MFSKLVQAFSLSARCPKGVSGGRSLFLLFLFIILISSSLYANSKGIISGKVVDSESGSVLIGANVLLMGTDSGSSTDLEGVYRIANVAPGQYTLQVSYMGYKKTEITGVQVKAGDVTPINVTLEFQVLEGEEVVVTAKAVRNTEAVLLKDRQKASAVSDAVSAEAISRVGSGNAADAMKQVTGASVVGGKYVFIRGLGDRYTSTQLNGAEIPSTNPYKRAGTIDLIPTSLVDNIVTVKSFTPDKPGNFSGGTVDIKTKDFPDAFSFNFSGSTSYNSQANLSNATIFYAGGGTDWLGIDDGSRDLPALLSDPGVVIPRADEGRSNYEVAKTLDAYTKAFSSIMRPGSQSFPLNQSYSLSIGNQFNVGGRPLGFLASLSYSNSYSFYDNGEFARWDLGSAKMEDLVTDLQLKDTQSSQEVLWGGLFKTSYKLHPFHKISANLMYNRNAESVARYLEGVNGYDLDEDVDTYQTSVLHYIERELTSMQLSGEHLFPFLLGSNLSWRVSRNDNNQDEPDRRTFSSYVRDLGDGEVRYGIRQNTPPERYYRTMEESRNEYGFDLDIPLEELFGKSSKLKVGGLIANKERNYNERKFYFSQSPSYNYDGDAETLFSEGNAGLTDSSVVTIRGQEYKTYSFGLVVLESNTPASIYTGTEDVSAYYALMDLPIFSKLRFIGGARYETTDMYVETMDDTKSVGDLETSDVLPSANLIYNLSNNMNVRFAYGKTLARPNLREMAPYASEDFKGDFVYIGNPDLERTLIDNFDLRWEWFSRPGEIYAISGFYKDFTNPIEEVILNSNRHVMWENVDQAEVMGLEFEARKRLDVIHSSLGNFLLGGNVSLVHSAVSIGEEELSMIRDVLPNAEDTRPLEGQSPYIVNVNLSYDNSKYGIASTLYFNVFGERLSSVSLGATPDVYEQPAPLLNWSLGWKLASHLSLNASAKNILDSDIKKTLEYNGKEYVYNMYKRGRSFSLGLKYSL